MAKFFLGFSIGAFLSLTGFSLSFIILAATFLLIIGFFSAIGA